MEIKYRKWRGTSLPKKVLFIRMQALGDITITLPYISGFHKAYPDVEIHFLTRAEDAEIPTLFPMFTRVFKVRGGRNRYKQLFYLLLLLPTLIYQGYDIVYDLQNRKISRILRNLPGVRAWTSFDKLSNFPAGDRTYHTMKAVGLTNFTPSYSINEKALNLGKQLLKEYQPVQPIFIINPAGFFESRNWPESYYHRWAKLVLEFYKGEVTFLFVGIDRIKDKADNFEKAFPDNTLNLVNQTTILEAFALVQNADFMLSEDSGLMHMSWVSGIPTLALFGSSRSDWSRPLGNHSLLLDSSDLACGDCLLQQCKFLDNRCLTRYDPEFVFNQSKKLF